MMSALERQEGGSHYTKLKIQPMEYSMANGLDACQHTAIKYITRFRDKDGINDLRKAIHVIEMLIEFEMKKQHPVVNITCDASAAVVALSAALKVSDGEIPKYTEADVHVAARILQVLNNTLYMQLLREFGLTSTGGIKQPCYEAFIRRCNELIEQHKKV